MTDRILGNIQHTGLFNNFYKSKLISLGFLIISLLGAKGRKDRKINYKTAFTYVVMGLLIYFLSHLSLYLRFNPDASAIVYMSISVTGFILILTGGTLRSRIIQLKLNNQDIFNKEDVTFPQEERLIKTSTPSIFRLFTT